MPNKNHFAALGLEPTASPEEIKKAYRRLAMQHHPDRNPGDPGAAEKFKAVQESYDHLADDSRRQVLAGQLQSRKRRKAMTAEERTEWLMRHDPNLGNIIDVEPPPFQFGPKREETKFVDAYAKYYMNDSGPHIR